MRGHRNFNSAWHSIQRVSRATRMRWSAGFLAVAILGAAVNTFGVGREFVLASGPTNPPLPPGTIISSPFLFSGQSYVSQSYGCTSLNLEPQPPDGRCNGAPAGETRWHTGIDIAGGSVQCGST